MNTLALDLAQSSGASAARSLAFRWKFRQLSLTGVRVLVATLAIALCLSLCAPMGWQHQSLDERAVLSAMLAAGGMPLVYSPPALCTAPNQQPRFDQSEMRTLF
jgi:hypothetical protein